MASNLAPVTAQKEAILWPALKVAAGAGAGGLIFGGTVGILQSPTPALFAGVASLQWALLGGTFWGIRTGLLNTRIQEKITLQTKLYSSMCAGGLTAAVVGAATRGRKNVIPGVFMGLLAGYIGQSVYNRLDRQHTAAISIPSSKDALWKRALNSRLSPMKVLTDEQYALILKEKLLRAETEIALIDDDIAKWRKEQQKTKSEEN